MNTDKESLEDTVEELQGKVETLENNFQVVKSQAKYLADHSIEVEERIEELEQENRKLKRMIGDGVDVVGEGKLSPIERVLIFGWDNTELTKRQSSKRAVTVVENFYQLSTKVTSERFVSITDIQDFLSIQEDEEVRWTTAERTAKKISDLSNEKFYITDGKGGKVLVKDAEAEWYENEDDILLED